MRQVRLRHKRHMRRKRRKRRKRHKRRKRRKRHMRHKWDMHTMRKVLQSYDGLEVRHLDA